MRKYTLERVRTAGVVIQVCLTLLVVFKLFGVI